MTVMSLLALMLSDTKVSFKNNQTGEHTEPRTVLNIMEEQDIKETKYLCATILDLAIIRMKSDYGGLEKVLEVTI